MMPEATNTETCGRSEWNSTGVPVAESKIDCAAGTEVEDADAGVGADEAGAAADDSAGGTGTAGEAEAAGEGEGCAGESSLSEAATRQIAAPPRRAVVMTTGRAACSSMLRRPA